MEWPPTDLPRDFPLTVHERGYVKKDVGWVCGKKPWREALAIYHTKAAAKLNKSPVPKTEVILRGAGDDQTVDQLIERWLKVKAMDADAGVITHDHYVQCGAAAARFRLYVVDESVPGIGNVRIGATPIKDLLPDHFSDFARACRAERGDPFARKQASLILALFNHAAEEAWIPRPVAVGKVFRKTAKLKGEPVRKSPPTADQVRAVVAYLDKKIAALRSKTWKSPAGKKKLQRRDPSGAEQLLAGVLLAVNAGYGATDCSELPKDPLIVNLDDRFVDYRRGKTYQTRRFPLMEETATALAAVWKQRPGDALVFRTRSGHLVARKTAIRDEGGNVVKVIGSDALNHAYSKVLRKLGFKIRGNGFYKIKDLHAATADAFGDDRAARVLTGHADPRTSGDIRDTYVDVTRQRLEAVVDFIRHEILLSPSMSKAERARIGQTPARSPSQAAALKRQADRGKKAPSPRAVQSPKRERGRKRRQA